MPGRPPDDLVWEFAQDTFTLTTDGLARKYNIAERTVRDWRLHCKRQLSLQVGYGQNETDEPIILFCHSGECRNLEMNVT